MEKQILRLKTQTIKSVINSERSVLVRGAVPHSSPVVPSQSEWLDTVELFSLPNEAVSVGITISWPSMPSVRTLANPHIQECPFVQVVSRFWSRFGVQIFGHGQITFHHEIKPLSMLSRGGGPKQAWEGLEQPWQSFTGVCGEGLTAGRVIGPTQLRARMST